MTDAPPQLGEIPQSSQFRVPTLQSNMDSNSSNSDVQSAKNNLYNSQVGYNRQRISKMLANEARF